MVDVEPRSPDARDVTRFANWVLATFIVGWVLILLCEAAEQADLISDVWESILRLVVWCGVVCLLIYAASRSSFGRPVMATLIVFAVCSGLGFVVGLTEDIDSVDRVPLVGSHGAMNHMFKKLLWAGWTCSIAYLFFLLVRALDQSVGALRTEIRERRRADEALRMNEQRLKLALDATRTSCWDVNLKTGDLVATKPSIHWLGYEPDEIEQTREWWKNLIHPDDATISEKALHDHLDGRSEVYQCEFRIRGKSGEWFWTLDRGVIVERDDTGTPLRIVGTDTDITERKRAEEAIRQSNSRLEETLDELRATQKQVIQQERLSALGEMASGIAHDLNNTLAPVLGYSDVLVNDPSLSGDARKRLTLVRAGARDAAGVVARLREFSRPSDLAGSGEILELAPLVHEIVELTRPKWRDGPQRQGWEIELNLELEDTPPVFGNGVELRQVVTNLVFNAVDALPHGGKITFGLRSESGDVLIEVADTGQGMPAEVEAKCFEPFFTTKGERGTGLVLSVCHGIVQRYGGRIHVESFPRRGTTARVILPAAEVGRPVEEASSAGSLSAARVLYIDDDAEVRASAQFMLEALGQKVDVADSGPHGMEMLAANDYDLVMTDLGMPEMDGNEVTRKIKATHPDLPVLMVTGWGSSSSAEPCKSDDGPDYILGKPHTLDELRDVLAKMLRA